MMETILHWCALLVVCANALMFFMLATAEDPIEIRQTLRGKIADDSTLGRVGNLTDAAMRVYIAYALWLFWWGAK